MIQRWIVIAGEEAGPASNKMGGIWNVIYAESHTMAELVANGKIEDDVRILVAGPYYRAQGSDWNRGKARVTDFSGYQKLSMGSELDSALSSLAYRGIESVTFQETVDDVAIGYVLFPTDYYQSRMTRWHDAEMTFDSAIKTEAYDLLGLDSMKFEHAHYGDEYSHYLDLSYAISELARTMTHLHEETTEKYGDKAVSEFARALLPKLRLSLHCHEFGVFYAIARLKKLGVPVRTMATLHATAPGRTAGFKTQEKIARNDAAWDPAAPIGMATLESLARYADVVTFVGYSTMKEALLFYNMKGIVVRNGIDVPSDEIDWAKKDRCRAKIQKFLAKNLYKFHDGRELDPEGLIPLFTISRIEIENKGYPQLLDALALQDHLIKNRTMGQRRAEEVKVICFLIAAHGPKPKDKLPEGFPVNLPPEILVGDEIRLQKMIDERGLGESSLISGKRDVSAVLYPQWVSTDDGGLNMTADEIMAGCVAGIFPSQYEPFLLTALEAGREGTPSIVSRAAGFSEALKKVKRRVPGLGGVVVVDNIETIPEEVVLDYALAMDYFTWTYLEDQVKYRLLCEESFSLAKQMSWEEPVMEYYNNLVA
jgi:glycosyltransferase involved in cell wall biosynthesis